MRGRTLGRRRAVVVAAVVIAIAIAVTIAVLGGNSVDERDAESMPQAAGSPTGPALEVSVLTPNGGDVYEVDGEAGAFEVIAPESNDDINLRVGILPDDAPTSADQGACMTWVGLSGDVTQPGLVLRHSDEGGRVRAVMVTQNVLYAARSNINVHVVDSDTEAILDHVDWADVGQSIGTLPYMRSLPWRFCARIRGDEVDVKAWPVADPVPPWGVPGYGGTVPLPADAPTSGRPGGYFGHLRPGEVAEAVDLDVWTEGIEDLVEGAQEALRSTASRLMIGL